MKPANGRRSRMSFGDLRIEPAYKTWVCPGCEKEIKGSRITTRWRSPHLGKDIQICQACTRLLFRMDRLYRLFGPDPIPARSTEPQR